MKWDPITFETNLIGSHNLPKTLTLGVPKLISLIVPLETHHLDQHPPSQNQPITRVDFAYPKTNPMQTILRGIEQTWIPLALEEIFKQTISKLEHLKTTLATKETITPKLL